MTNQEQYELICEKARKYDRIKGAKTTREDVICMIKSYLDGEMWKYEACPLNKEDLEIIIEAIEELQYHRDLAASYAKTIIKLTKALEREGKQ